MKARIAAIGLLGVTAYAGPTSTDPPDLPIPRAVIDLGTVVTEDIVVER